MQHLIDTIQTLAGEFFLLLIYHKTCYVRFVNPNYFKPKLETNKDANPCDTSDESVIDFAIKEILSNQDNILNSVETYDVYTEYGGRQHLPSNEIRLINRISELLKEKVYLFKSPGVVTVLIHKQKV